MIRVLLIDSDPGERLIQCSRLGDLGYDVQVAETGARGIVEVRATRYEAILICAELESGASAAEVCRRIKAVPELRSVPVLVFSRARGGVDPESHYDAGCQAFVGREQLDVLDRVLVTHLRTKQREDELRETARQLDLRCRRLEEQGGGEASADATSAAAALPSAPNVHPEGVLVVDGEGRLRHADRGAVDVLGRGLIGKHLAEVTPNTGLEAFVRDAHSVTREGFRFEVSARRDRRTRVLRASVVPVPFSVEDGRALLRVVLLTDATRRDDTASDEAKRLETGVLTEAAHSMYTPDLLVGGSSRRTALRQRVRELAPSREPTLVRGDRGTGKCCIARILHYSSEATGPFYQLHCGALGEATLEKQLFGDGTGSTGPGLLAAAQGGSLVLLEVGQLPLRLQGRLLEILGQGAVPRTGSGRATPLRTRVLATTTISLDQLVTEGRFLADLAVLLGTHAIDVPALATHAEDVPQLVEAFLRRYGPGYGITGISQRALMVLGAYDWPANVGELEDCIEQACARAQGGEIDVLHLSRSVRAAERQLGDVALQHADASDPHTLQPMPSFEHRRPAQTPRRWDITDTDPVSLEHYEMKVLLRALDACSGDKLEAARLLQVGKSTLYRKLKKFGIA